MSTRIRRPFVLAIGLAIVILVTVLPRIASADRPLGNHSLKGTYKGTNIEIRQDPGFPVEYCQGLTTAIADGRGTITIDSTRRCSLSGTAQDVETGTYSVDADGVVRFAFGAPDTGKGIVGGGGEFVIIDNFDPAVPDPNVLAFHGIFARVF